MLKIIHISSSGKSGSTLLNIILGNYREIFAGAELFRYSRLWTRAEVIKCASGELASASDFWTKVKKAIGGENMHIVEDEVHPQHVPALMHAILRESGAEIVCDTSKSRKYSRVIYDRQHYDPFVIHLVRDGRAVVLSANQPFWPSLKVGVIWCIANIQTKIKHRGKKNYLCLSYEDLVFNRDSTIKEIESRIASYFKLDLTLLPYDKKTNTYRHAFAGNRMRDSFDGVIKFDSRYLERSQMGKMHWGFLTIIMLPAIIAFGYPLGKEACKVAFGCSGTE